MAIRSTPQDTARRARWERAQQRRDDNRVTRENSSVEADESSTRVANVEALEEMDANAVLNSHDRPLGWWMMRNHRWIRFQDMSDSHLQNVRALVERRAAQSSVYREILNEIENRESMRALRQAQQQALRQAQQQAQRREAQQRIQQVVELITGVSSTSTPQSEPPPTGRRIKE